MHLVAVDPGGTTGIAQYAPASVAQPFKTWMMPAVEAATFIKSRIWPDTLVLCERYVITPQTIKMTRQLDALELIGWTRYTCLEIGARFKLQSPADAKKMPLPLGWHTPGPDHADMAAKHLILGLLQFYPDEYARLVE